MAPNLPACPLLPPSPSLLRHSIPTPIKLQFLKQQTRNATYVLRHRRPYQFTQLVQLSDGSTYTCRTTSPLSLYKSAKDSRNHTLWQPSDKSLRNIEVDEAGKLAAFRERFGRGWDMSDNTTTTEESTTPEMKAEAKAVVEEKKEEEIDPFDSLVDLISGYATADNKNTKGGLSAKDQAKKDKAKKK
ncbi:hypothetical protein QBC38DRAFT_488656 [Podospora fimiseda]|uniref:Ribosomal protein bL31m N-terminal domain-containing protein n=1 Tax=Podospora fimiseda TaxID=252190 RepID=A0AAN6YU38_9PEZI|nr:hypothetical protein QBC38DRAFT_488656 [Podospora fimiseda]